MTELKPFDAADYLDCDEAIEAYLEDALISGEAAEVAQALVVIARAKAMTDVANKAGLAQDGVVAGPNDWPTLLRVMTVLGLRLTPVTVKPAA